LMSKDLVIDLCYAAKINFDDLEVEELEENWGQVKGGRGILKK